MVFDYIAGWEKQIGDKTIVQSGQLPIFRNDDGNGSWLNRPNTIWWIASSSNPANP
jgi:type III restriction enzyme